MEHGESSNMYDDDILQCKVDIERAHQNSSSLKRACNPQINSEEKNYPPTAVRQSTQSIAGKTRTNLKNQILEEKKTKNIIKTVYSESGDKKQVKIVPTLVKASEPLSDTTEMEDKSSRAFEDNYTTYNEMPTASPVEAKEKTESEKAECSQGSEIKFIEQVKSMMSGGEYPNGQEVPRFDLAEQIMAEQRKTSAAKRKAPTMNVSIDSRFSHFVHVAGLFESALLSRAP